MSKLKNIESSKVIELGELVGYMNGQIVSRTLVQNNHHSITLFSFDEGEEISTHESGGDALLQVLEGKSSVTIADECFLVSGGESILMPAGVPHAVFAKEKFKMLLTVIF